MAMISHIILFLLLLTSYANGKDLSSKLSEIDNDDIYEYDFNIFNGIYTEMAKVYQYAFDTAKTVGGFFNNVKQSAIQAALDGSETVKDAFLETLVTTTFDFAVDCYVVSRDTANGIQATFNFTFSEDEYPIPPSPLTLEEIVNLEIKGDSNMTNEFISALLALLEKQNNNAPKCDIYTLLEYHIIKLLTDNAILSAQQFSALVSRLNMSTILEGFKSTVSAMKPVFIFIKELQPKMVGFARDAHTAISNLQWSLQTQAVSVIKSSVDLLTNSLESTVNVAVSLGVFSKQTGYALLSIVDTSLTTESDLLDTINNGIMDANFKATLKDLLFLKNNGAPKVIIMGGLQASILTLLADKAIVASSTVTPLLKALGLNSISSSLNSATKFMANLRNHIPIAATGATKLYNNMKNSFFTKLLLQMDASQDITVDIFTQGLETFDSINGNQDTKEMDLLIGMNDRQI